MTSNNKIKYNDEIKEDHFSEDEFDVNEINE